MKLFTRVVIRGVRCVVNKSFVKILIPLRACIWQQPVGNEATVYRKVLF